MSKIEEIAIQKANDWRDKYLDAWTESEAEIARDAFADGYRRALVDLYPVVKPDDLVENKWYHLGDCGIDGSEWNIGQFFGVIDGNFRFFIEGLLFEFSDCPLIRGPILNPIEVGIVGGEG